MWIYILYSLALVHGALAEVDCTKDPFEQCETPAIFSFVPPDVSEFNRLCPEAPAYLRCLKNIQDQCGTESSRVFASEKQYEGMHGAFSDVCEEGTYLNRVVTENLRCLSETFRNTVCPEVVEVVTGPYRSHDMSYMIEYTLPIEVMCLQDILESDCILADIGDNCGKDVLEATVEFLRRSYYIEYDCGKHTAEILLKDLDKYNLNQQQKALVIATLEKVIISAQK